MLAHSPRDRSRSPHRPTSPSRGDSTSKSKKDNDQQLRLKSLKSFIQTLSKDLSLLGNTTDEQNKGLENACIREYPDLSLDRIKKMIRSLTRERKSPVQTESSDRFSSTDSSTLKKSRSIPNTKTSELSTASLTGLDADFLRHAFSQQYRPSLDLASYFSVTGNGTNANSSSLFRSNYSPSNFLQSLTASNPSLLASHSSLNGSHESTKLSSTETNSMKVLINAYREAASYLYRSADELEQLL